MGAAPILTILKDGEAVRSVPIEGDALLGRDEGCVIRLEDRMISRRHALFRRRGDQVQVEKKSEFAPLLVNGSECTQAVLKDGDVIGIGPYQLKISLEEQQITAPVAAEAPAAMASLEDPMSQNAMAQGSVVESESPELEINPLNVDSPVAADPLAGAPGVTDSPFPELESPPESLAPPAENVLSLQDPEPAADPAAISENVATLEPLNEAAPASPSDFQGGVLTLDPPDVTGGEDRTRVLASKGPEFWLAFKEGDADVTQYRMEKDEIAIGRGKDCDVVLSGKRSSRKNAVLVRSGNVITIKDLGSANGTYVNGQKITETVLEGGDKIKIGDAEFEFRAEQPGYSDQEKDFLSVPSLSERTGVVELPPFEMDAGMVPMLSPDSPIDNGFQGEPQSADPVVVDPNAGIAGIAGIAGVSSGKRKSLMEKFRALPKSRQWMVIGLVIVFGYFFFLDEDEPLPNAGQKQTQGKKSAKKKTAGAKEGETAETGQKTARSFGALSKEKQNFIRTQHKLAFEYFQHQDYANALAAIKPIFEYVDDYEDSREIQRYAEDGIRQMKIIAEEKAKKEAEEAKARKLTELINKGRELMEKKKYSDASTIFNDILVIDPENAQVAQWQAKIREHEEDLKIQAQKRQVQAEVSKQAWAVYKEGLAIRRNGQLRKALAVFAKVKEIGAVDARPARLAAEQIQGIHDEIQNQLEPLLKEGKEKEDGQDYVSAMVAYEKALRIEPESSDASKGLSRVKVILNDRAKLLYTEAVLAESYSDFAAAKKKFQQCLETAPQDSLYHDRATRKLARYFKSEEINTTVGP